MLMEKWKRNHIFIRVSITHQSLLNSNNCVIKEIKTRKKLSVYLFSFLYY